MSIKTKLSRYRFEKLFLSLSIFLLFLIGSFSEIHAHGQFFEVTGHDSSKAPVGYLGVGLMPVPEIVRAHTDLAPQSGIMVSHVLPKSPAEKSGLQQWDILRSFDGETLTEISQLQKLVKLKSIGEQAFLKILRKGHEETIEIIIEEMPHNINFSLPSQMKHGVQGQIIPKNYFKNYKDWQQSGITYQASQAAMQRALISKIIGSKDFLSYSDEEHQMTIERREGKKWLIVKKPEEDHVIWEGFIETEDEKNKVPNEISKKIKNMDFFSKSNLPMQQAISELMKNLDSGAQLNLYVTDPSDVEKLKTKIKGELRDVKGQMEAIQGEISRVEEEIKEKD